MGMVPEYFKLCQRRNEITLKTEELISESSDSEFWQEVKKELENL